MAKSSAAGKKAILKNLELKSGGNTGRVHHHDAMDVLNYGMERLGITLQQVAEGTFITVPTLARLLERGGDTDFRCLNTTPDRVLIYFGHERSTRFGVKISSKYQNKPKE